MNGYELSLHPAVREAIIPGVLCPSSTRSDEADFDLQSGDYADPYLPAVPFPLKISRIHYVGSIGSTTAMDQMPDGASCPSFPSPSEGSTYLNGMFFRNSERAIEHILDGSSNTIMVGERSAEIFDSTWVGVVHSGARCHVSCVASGWMDRRAAKQQANQYRSFPRIRAVQ